MPTRGSLTVRAQFHNVPIELPPLPSDTLHVLEHSYEWIIIEKNSEIMCYRVLAHL